jgi:hypothetical protein
MNHSDFATWLVMALPPQPVSHRPAAVEVDARRLPAAAAGHSTTRDVADHRHRPHGGRSVVGLSRSGLIRPARDSGGLVAVGRTDAAAGPRPAAGRPAHRAHRAAYANTNAISVRSRDDQAGARWTERDPARNAADDFDFWLIGVGPGAHERGMIVISSRRASYFNHAHNEYLQIAAEGAPARADGARHCRAGAWRIR